ncbi:hypothetical protein EST38_g1337 [Candolleomyces aberdarensis]|uniref:Protein kinase domain-containing protein n=1 Tax=Candolleomyces aberdarensis TaxID=2316362 RepID=A0A4Q2DZJ3_9AGAR|nr:hypothetical protein EST38_g1337 [Candolleomyces aberdarensis]
MNLGLSGAFHPAKVDFTRRDEFDILGQLQHSGSSKIYRVVSKRGRLKNRVTALKISTSTHGQAQMHQSLHHPNVVTLFSCFGDPGAYVYLFEYCHGGNLRDYLENLGRPGLDHKELKSLVRSMASALLYLQGKRIIHRSVEPRNILISTTNLFKLHNFEDAVYFCEGLQDPCKNVTPYSAPELVAREPYSYSADAWSVGCVFLAACVGPVSVELLAEKVEDIQLPEESTHFDQLQVLLGNTLLRDPSQRMTPMQILSQDWITPRSESDASVYDTQEDKPSLTATPSVSAGASSLGLGYPSSSRNTAARKQVGSVPRSASDPTFKTQPSNETTYLGLRSFSESVDREKLIQFFMKPADRANGPQPQTESRQRSSETESRNERPSGGLPAEEILLVDPLKQDVQIHALPSRDAGCRPKLTKPRHEYPISELPEPHNTIYLEALALLEEIKQRTPMLTLHMVDGKCTMMCNSPLPDIEIILRVDPPTQSLSSRTMFRIRLFRRLQRLEFAQRTSNDKSSEWLKRIVPSTDNYPYVQAADWNSLDDLEKRGIQILKKFILVCDSALELGLHPIESGDDPSDLVDTLNEEPTFDSDFTPNFVPDLASSLPPRPLRRHKT